MFRFHIIVNFVLNFYTKLLFAQYAKLDGIYGVETFSWYSFLIRKLIDDLHNFNR